jgi:hypothetical protein
MAAIIIGVIWYYEANQMPITSQTMTHYSIPSSTQGLAESSTSTSTPTANNTSTWRTYSDPQGRFTFQYYSSIFVGEAGESTALGTYSNPVSGIKIGSHTVFSVIDTPELKADVAHYIDELKNRDGGVDSAPCEIHALPNSLSVVTTYSCGEEYDAYVAGPNSGIWMDGFNDGSQNTTDAILSSIQFGK